MCEKKDTVDMIINILQVLTLRQGSKQLEKKIEVLGKRKHAEDDSEEGESDESINDQREI